MLYKSEKIHKNLTLALDGRYNWYELVTRPRADRCWKFFRYIKVKDGLNPTLRIVNRFCLIFSRNTNAEKNFCIY